ncbi:MAG: asparagine synthase-related protein [Woeseiaceae bacterium]|nr:asparagine synthase-related protein [Woeseiaceae bacterium]
MTSFAVIANRRAPSAPQEIIEALNPLGLLRSKSSVDGNLLLCVAHHDNAPCRAAAFKAFEDHSCILAGDVIGHDGLDWEEIRHSLVSGNAIPGSLRELRGAFAIVVTDVERDRLWVVTDPSAWLPVQVARTDRGVAVSTSLAAIVRAFPEAAAVDENWIYETLYFNHGIGATTPVRGADRLPPGTVIEVDLLSGETAQRAYRDRPRRLSRLVNGTEAVDEAISAFQETVPRYFPDDLPVTMGVSEGLDCRTVLAALPASRIAGLHSFTFGRATSTEINETAEIAGQLGLLHAPVHLDQAFLEQLPQLARDTVFLSDGLQNINRSHLLYTYGQLRHESEPFSVIMTGVSGDHIFRDHIQGWGNVPHILSADAAAQHRNGRAPVDATFYRVMFGDSFQEFEQRIESCLDHVEGLYGGFQDPEAYLSYLMFEAGPRYFGGQAAIANTFSTFRTPYWDPDIIELGYRLQDATIGFSATLAKKDPYGETAIQAAVIAAHETVGQLPYKRLPIEAYANRNKAAFQAYKLLRRLRNIVERYTFVYSEDWPLWYRTTMQAEVQRLLGDDSRLRNYVSSQFISRAVSDNDVHWLGKLVSTEHTLRFIENGWRRS